MSMNRSKARDGQEPVEAANSCPVCNEMSRRDEALLDALQQARYILSGSDGIRDPLLRLARVKAAVDQAMKLMQPRRW